MASYYDDNQAHQMSLSINMLKISDELIGVMNAAISMIDQILSSHMFGFTHKGLHCCSCRFVKGKNFARLLS